MGRTSGEIKPPGMVVYRASTLHRSVRLEIILILNNSVLFSFLLPLVNSVPRTNRDVMDAAKNLRCRLASKGLFGIAMILFVALGGLLWGYDTGTISGILAMSKCYNL